MRIFTLLSFILSIPFYIKAQNNGFYDKCNKLPISQGIWNNLTSSSDAVYVVGDNGRCFISYLDGGILDISTGVSQNLHGVQFLSPLIGFAWGNQGTLIKTTNGGLDWNLITIPVQDSIAHTQFIDQSNGYFLANGSLFKTTNGGLSWTQLNLPQDLVTNSFHFLNLNEGLITANNTVGPNFAGKIFKTINGGVTWIEKASGPLLGNLSNIYSKLKFVNDHVGYAPGGGFSISKTIDRGETWSVPDFTGSGTPILYSDIYYTLSARNNPDTIIYFYNLGGAGTPRASYGLYGPNPWGIYDAGEAIGIKNISLLSHNGIERLYVLSETSLYAYFLNGPIPIAKKLSFTNVVIPNATNPHNLIEPGRKVRFKVLVKNLADTIYFGNNNLLTLSGKLRCNSPYLTIVDSLCTFNNVLEGDSAWSADEFEFEIDSNIPNGHIVNFDIEIDDEILLGGPWNNCLSFPYVKNPFIINNTVIDDDNIPDSQGNNNNIAEPGETIEILPLADNSTQHKLSNITGTLFSYFPEIKIWNDTMGSTTTVYNKYPYGQFLPLSLNQMPNEDFVFENNFLDTYNLEFSMLFQGNISVFSTGIGQIKTFESLDYLWGTGFVMNAGYPNPPLALGPNTMTSSIVFGPNPFNYECTFKIGDYKNYATCKLTIYNILGEVIQVLKFENDSISFKRGNLKNGIYLFSIEDGNLNLTRGKIIIE